MPRRIRAETTKKTAKEKPGARKRADPKPTPRRPSSAAAGEVSEFLARLAPQRRAEIEAVRAFLLAVDPAIGEGIKWNAPSFRTSEWFATFHLRAKEGVQLILHLGAKARDGSRDVEIEDPGGLLEWLSSDRASVKLRDLDEIRSRGAALQRIVRQWIAHVR